MSAASWKVMLLPLACALLVSVLAVPAPVPRTEIKFRPGSRQAAAVTSSDLIPYLRFFRRLPILERLIANATLIREDIKDTFNCGGKNYGFYADKDNDCQIFHVCLNYQQLFPSNFSRPVVVQYSFICPEHTIFSQEALVCAWKESAFPCEYAEQMYSRNDIFFKEDPEKEGFGRRVPVNKVKDKGATVVEVLPPPPAPLVPLKIQEVEEESPAEPPKRDRVPIKPAEIEVTPPDGV
ncbi:uncharacterized protein LOC143037250 [Oratosquilla oratoria]|uniref:uncharacterized protein LOC143037250 n=1 Tax=Oratosquilla oratoria TaxID=337810 RepID=UPI003F759D6B